jgi:ABC-type transporter MlaC component
VDKKVLPHFNFQHMTALAMGKEWRKASPQQQQQLTAEFKTLLVRTYSNALTSYKNQKVVYKAFKMAPTDTDVLVRTEVHQPGNKPVQLDYSLERLEGAGRCMTWWWRVSAWSQLSRPVRPGSPQWRYRWSDCLDRQQEQVAGSESEK